MARPILAHDASNGELTSHAQVHVLVGGGHSLDMLDRLHTLNPFPIVDLASVVRDHALSGLAPLRDPGREAALAYTAETLHQDGVRRVILSRALSGKESTRANRKAAGLKAGAFITRRHLFPDHISVERDVLQDIANDIARHVAPKPARDGSDIYEVVYNPGFWQHSLPLRLHVRDKQIVTMTPVGDYVAKGLERQQLPDRPALRLLSTAVQAEFIRRPAAALSHGPCLLAKFAHVGPPGRPRPHQKRCPPQPISSSSAVGVESNNEGNLKLRFG